ncbi:30S ribosomal protein S9 [Citrus sinensis]|uniref:30S ribosomal protein S9 n=1 Tax=Citrus sinensis TaxID=2711 RepID=A0ACB8JEP6_CITSI|nr:30S ribosomal protein S9 [Citrus sinensis]
MLSRMLLKPSHFRLLTNLSPKSHFFPQNPSVPPLISFSRFLSSNNNSNNNNQSSSNVWNLSREIDGNFDQLFGDTEAKDVGQDELFNEEENQSWSFGEGVKDGSFEIGESAGTVDENGRESGEADEESKEELRMLQLEEKQLTAELQGPSRAFGDLIAASGITDAMLESLIALKDLEGEMRYEKNTRKSTRAEIERQKQEEVAKARVRQVDEKGRAYGTGRRKCSIARVWIQPGDGKFIVNDKEFDVYFPMLDHRAALLRPFSETKTLGLWDVDCTVKGGGVSGQVGAIRLGISRALQNWEPDLRPALRSTGFLTRDSRVVERKKPGKAKARKSFQWVKR